MSSLQGHPENVDRCQDQESIPQDQHNISEKALSY